jgi:heptose I phosphotransferase
MGLLDRWRQGVSRFWCTPEWPGFAGEDWPETIMAVDTRDRLHEKQGRTIVRWTLKHIQGRTHTVYLKRHFRLARKDGLLKWLRPGRAYSPGWQEFENLAAAQRLGLPVPRVSAVGEMLLPGGRIQGFIAVDELTDMIGLHEAVPRAFAELPPEEFARWKRGLTHELARLTRQLHRHRAFHKDLYFCHFYILASDTAVVPENWRERVIMIDFHRFAFQRLGWQWYLIKDLAQFWYSSDVPGVTTRDRLRFWKAYRGGDWAPASAPGQWFRKPIWRKYQLYANQHLRRARRLARPRSS